MAQCLVTKLKGTVVDDTLLKLGELRFKVSSIASPTGNTQKISLTFKKVTTVSIVGTGYFTSEDLTQNNGTTVTIPAFTTTILYLSNGNYSVSIGDKYLLTRLDCFGTVAIQKKQFTFNLRDFRYLPSLSYLHLSYTETTGNLSALTEIVALVNLYLTGTKVTGNIASLHKLSLLVTLYLNEFVTGNIESLKTLTSLASIDIKRNTNITGDVALLPSNLRFFTNTAGSKTLTWSSSRPSEANIIAIEGIYLGNFVDAMLINQANCIANFYGAEIWYKTIQVNGTKTNLSDAAVTMLQSKGYIITVVQE